MYKLIPYYRWRTIDILGQVSYGKATYQDKKAVIPKRPYGIGTRLMG
jgi:hypothetical protein